MHMLLPYVLEQEELLNTQDVEHRFKDVGGKDHDCLGPSSIVKASFRVYVPFKEAFLNQGDSPLVNRLVALEGTTMAKAQAIIANDRVITIAVKFDLG